MVGKSSKGSNNKSKAAGGMRSFKRGLGKAASPGISTAQLQVCDCTIPVQTPPVPALHLPPAGRRSAPRACLGASAPVLLPHGPGKAAFNRFPQGSL